MNLEPRPKQSENGGTGKRRNAENEQRIAKRRADEQAAKVKRQAKRIIERMFG